jgi:hypothetical protein
MERACEMFPELGMEPRTAMMTFNDHPEVRYADVRVVLEKIQAEEVSE